MKVQRQAMANEGRVCLTNPNHGPSLVMRSGREWCPHQWHDGNREKKRKPTASFLDKQEAVADGTAQSA
jgi:hypothetical protein